MPAGLAERLKVVAQELGVSVAEVVRRAVELARASECMNAAVQPLMPCAVRLQLVSPTKTLPVRPGWLYEPRLDRCRVLLRKGGTAVSVRTGG